MHGGNLSFGGVLSFCPGYCPLTAILGHYIFREGGVYHRDVNASTPAISRSEGPRKAVVFFSAKAGMRRHACKMWL